MIVNFLATYVVLYSTAWGTTKWATVTGVASGLLAVGVLGIVNASISATSKMYSSLRRYASMAKVLKILYVTVVGPICDNLLPSPTFDNGLSVCSYIMAWALLVIITTGARLAVRAL